MSSYFGKYRGTVEQNLDPLQQGRLQVKVPAVLGDGTLSWAMPCVPYAGSQVGFYAVPPIGANVWVEFEGGDPD
ncbi:MAG TPA: phage baseplate assembly protein V, partial [Solirubrobacterales bacterium]